MLVNYKALNIFNIGGEYKLKPGNNDLPIDMKTWEDLQKKYPKLKMNIDADLIEVIGVGEAPAARSTLGRGPAAPAPASSEGGVSSSPDITRFRDKDAVRLVKQTYDDQLLQKWHETESEGPARQPVLEAIEDQLAGIAKAAEPNQ